MTERASLWLVIGGLTLAALDAAAVLILSVWRLVS